MIRSGSAQITSGISQFDEVAAILVDVRSARQKAHEDLVDSERRYPQLIDAVVDYAIFQLDPAGKVTTWNPGAQRIKGYAPEDIIGRHFSAFYTPEDVENGVPTRALSEATRTL